MLGVDQSFTLLENYFYGLWIMTNMLGPNILY
jgi:hypothetical protein